MATAIPGNRYRHRKGGEYVVLNIAEHTETNEQMVVYQNTESGKVWVRPKAMWEDEGRFLEVP